jgi:hypothetical protein
MKQSAGSLADLGALVEKVWRNRWLRSAAIIAGFAAVTVVTALIARPRMFSIIMSYDDEGYMLTALKSFIHRDHLYNEVFAQYGPFYYEFWGGLFSIFGIPVTHDAGRTITTIVWVGSSLGLGLVTMRLTRSLLLGLGTQILCFTALNVLVNEPMHPGGTVTLLLVAILGAAVFVGGGRSTKAMALLGVATAALILTKINVGAFALISIALACAVSYPVLLDRRWVRPLVEAIFVLTPIALMSGKFGEGWAVHYSFHVAVAALAVVIALRAAMPPRREEAGELKALVAGLVGFAVLVLVIIVIAGTSPAGLWEGLISLPLNQSKAFSIPTLLAKRIWAADVVALAGACGYFYLRRRTPGGELGRGWVMAISLLSIAVGVEMALSVIGKTFPSIQLSFPGTSLAGLAFVWVALIPLGRGDRGVSFARLLLPLLACLQSLHAFPVAGSQLGWATLLLIPVGALCVGNGIRGLATVTSQGSERWLAVAVAAVAVVVGAQFLINTQLEEPLNFNRSIYASREHLDLPGDTIVRVTPEEVTLYRGITSAIDKNCPAFLTEPGLGSFYLWTRQEPPTGFFATAWTTLFDEKLQDRVIEETKDIKGLCLLRNIPLAETWSYGPVPRGALVEYLERGFQPVATFGTYELLRRPG